MKNYTLSILHCCLLILFFNQAFSAQVYSEKNNSVYTEEHLPKNRKIKISKVKGNSIQIDLSVLYGMNITPDSLIKDLKKAAITSVHVMVVNNWDGKKDDLLFKPEYLKAFRKNKIAVWLMLPGNCMYDTLPSPWQMEFLKPFADKYLYFYSFHNEEYVRWQEERVKRIFKNYDFDGIGFAESYFPEWNTINTNGHYGDVSLFARTKFTSEYLHSNGPTLTIDSIFNNAQLFSKWQDYRAEAILSFNLRMKNAVKKAKPDAIFASWAIAVLGGTVPELRKHYGLDLIEIAKKVSPDVFFIQTSYLEWGNPSLKPNYIAGYNYAKDAILKANPAVKVAIQADIASLSFHNPGVGVRLPEWWLEFMKMSKEEGYYTSTSYEYAFSKKQGLWVD